MQRVSPLQATLPWSRSKPPHSRTPPPSLTARATRPAARRAAHEPHPSPRGGRARAAAQVGTEEAAHRHRILEAVCGPRRLDLLAAQIRDKVRTRVAGGGGELARGFKLFAANNGTIRYDAFYHVAQAPPAPAPHPNTAARTLAPRPSLPPPHTHTVTRC
jgi:hypothetical protein